VSFDDGLPDGWAGLDAKGTPVDPEPESPPIPIAAGFAVLFGGLVGAIAAASVGLIAGLFAESDLTALDVSSPGLIRFLIVSSAGQFVAMAALLAMFSRYRGTGNWRNDFLLRMRPKDVYWMPLGTLVQIVSILLVALVAFSLGVEVPSQEAAEAIEDSQSLAQQIGLFFVIVVAAPVVEELLFRGLWLRAFRARMGNTGAVIVTSLLFGLAHLFDPSAAFLVPALVLVGVVLAIVTIRTNRLGPAIMIHAGFNLTTFVILLAPSFA